MSNIEEFANNLVQSLIKKIKDNKLDTQKITYWGFFGDPTIYKYRKIGAYGYVDFEDKKTIATSLDENMVKFDFSMKASDYMKYIEDNIIVIANEIFNDFLKKYSPPKSVDKQLVFNFVKEENENETIVHNS